MIQVTLNVIDFAMGIQEAITMPTIDASSRVTLIDSRIPQRIIHNLRDKGHRVEVVEEQPGNLGSFARPSGILLEYNVGRLHGGVDVFRPVTARGY